MRRTTLAGWALVIAAFLFGATFVVVKDAVSIFPPMSFVGWRFLLGGAVLLGLAWPKGGTTIWRDGFICGAFLFIGYALQTQGLTATTASNSALITGLFVVFTPLMAAVVNRKPPVPFVVVGAVIAFIGTALLTVTEGLVLQSGDLMTLGCALAFAAHIVALSRLAHRHPLVPFTAVQFLTTAALALPLSAAVEDFAVPGSAQVPALLVTALGASVGAFLLQIWAQTVVGPARAASILTLEPVFAVATAALIISERLTVSGWVGGALIVGAIYLVITASPETPVAEAEVISPAH
jgi:drug/metabolite transporter (DMT)-like permease